MKNIKLEGQFKPQTTRVVLIYNDAGNGKAPLIQVAIEREHAFVGEGGRVNLIQPLRPDPLNLTAEEFSAMKSSESFVRELEELASKKEEARQTEQAERVNNRATELEKQAARIMDEAKALRNKQTANT